MHALDILALSLTLILLYTVSWNHATLRPAAVQAAGEAPCNIKLPVYNSTGHQIINRNADPDWVSYLGEGAFCTNFSIKRLSISYISTSKYLVNTASLFTLTQYGDKGL